MIRLSFLGALAMVMGCGSTSSGSLPAHSEDIRENLVTLLEVGIGQARSDVIRPLIAPTYRQHNPRVSDGPAGLLGFVDHMVNAPPNRRVQVEVLRIFEDGEFVVSHSQYRRGGRIIAGFDIFRVADGLFTEHWDAGQRQPNDRANAHGMLDGRRALPADHSQTTENKNRVRQFTEEALIPRETTALLSFVTPAMVQHSPQIADGAAGWGLALADDSLPHPTELFRVLGEAEWVVTQSYGEALLDQIQQRVVIYDLYYLQGGKIVEHWDAVELVPDRMRHDNGML